MHSQWSRSQRPRDPAAGPAPFTAAGVDAGRRRFVTLAIYVPGSVVLARADSESPTSPRFAPPCADTDTSTEDT